MERIYSLGNGVIFDSLKNQIAKNSDIISLGSREAAILKLLCDHKNQIVNKTDLHDYVWGKVYVSETSLTKAISNLRRSLSLFQLSSSEIKTVPKEGYIFIYEDLPEPENNPLLQKQNDNQDYLISSLSQQELTKPLITKKNKSHPRINRYITLALSSSFASSLITGVAFIIFDFCA
ncbi:MAG: winged helix-turn-helix domain-containing protein [Plesiomonas sp.]|uniref:winged helix-turn-helix domain-containing protein n=1 Tax=Plesiomonas sp. TaxID=2486279 RepID=UPI003F3D2056